ncbi:MAG: hypothetical protein WBM17_07120, partial [Anaerolineales bacterium]
TPFTIWDEARFTSDGGQLQLRNYRSISYHRSTDLLWEDSVNYPQEALLSPDFSLYANRSSEYEILISKMRTNKTVSRLQSADTPMAFSPILNQFATIHFEPDTELRTIEIWNLESRKIHRTLEFPFPDNNRGIREVIFSPDGTLVALISWAGEERGDILLYNVMTGMVVEDFGINWTPIIAISSNGKMMVAECPWDEMGVLCMYDIDTGEKKIAYSADGSDFGRWTSLQISPNDGLVACGTSLGKIFLWDTTNGNLIRIAKGHNRAVTDLSFSPDGNRLASASTDGSVVVWDLDLLY